MDEEKKARELALLDAYAAAIEYIEAFHDVTGYVSAAHPTTRSAWQKFCAASDAYGTHLPTASTSTANAPPHPSV